MYVVGQPGAAAVTRWRPGYGGWTRQLRPTAEVEKTDNEMDSTATESGGVIVTVALSGRFVGIRDVDEEESWLTLFAAVFRLVTGQT